MPSGNIRRRRSWIAGQPNRAGRLMAKSGRRDGGLSVGTQSSPSLRPPLPRATVVAGRQFRRTNGDASVDAPQNPVCGIHRQKRGYQAYRHLRAPTDWADHVEMVLYRDNLQPAKQFAGISAEISRRCCSLAVVHCTSTQGRSTRLGSVAPRGSNQARCFLFIACSTKRPPGVTASAQTTGSRPGLGISCSRGLVTVAIPAGRCRLVAPIGKPRRHFMQLRNEFSISRAAWQRPRFIRIDRQGQRSSLFGPHARGGDLDRGTTGRLRRPTTSEHPKRHFLQHVIEDVRAAFDQDGAKQAAPARATGAAVS